MRMMNWKYMGFLKHRSIIRKVAMDIAIAAKCKVLLKNLRLIEGFVQ